MAKFDRRLIASVLKSFTRKFMQDSLDTAGMGIRADRRRIDTLERRRSDYMQITAWNSTTTGTGEAGYGPCPVIISKDGYIVNSPGVSSPGDPVTKEIRFLRGLPITVPFKASWVAGSGLPDAFNRAVCVIPGFDSSGKMTGAIYVTVKDDPSNNYGDTVSRDTVITLKTGGGIPSCTGVEESKGLLPDGSIWYHNWEVVGVPSSGIDIETLFIGISAGSASQYFDMYKAQEPGSVCRLHGGPDDNGRNYGFIKHPETFYLGESAVTSFFKKLEFLFDGDVDPAAPPAEFASSRASKALFIKVPVEYNDDGDILDLSSYCTGAGELNVHEDWIVTSEEVYLNNGENNALFRVYPVASRVDNDNILFCNGTIISRTAMRNGKFTPDTGTRQYILTGSSQSIINLSILSFLNQNGYGGEIAPWSEGGTGYYKALTTVDTDGNTYPDQTVWENDKEEYVFYKQRNEGTEGTVISSPMLSINRRKGYILLGGRHRTGDGEINTRPPRDLYGAPVGEHGVMTKPAEGMLSLIAGEIDVPPGEATRCGITFSRAFQNPAGVETGTQSYIYANYGTSESGDNDGSIPGLMDSSFNIVTQGHRLGLGVYPPGFGPSTAIGGSSPAKAAMFFRGTNPYRQVADKGDSGSMFTLFCKGGMTDIEAKDLPGHYEYRHVTLRKDAAEFQDKTLWSTYYRNRVMFDFGTGSTSLHDRRPNLSLEMFAVKDPADVGVTIAEGDINAWYDKAYIKLMRKVTYGGRVNSGAKVPGELIKGESGLYIGKRKPEQHLYYDGEHTVAELRVDGSGAQEGNTPLLMVGRREVTNGNTDEDPVVFAGLTSENDRENIGLHSGVGHKGLIVTKDDVYLSNENVGLNLRNGDAFLRTYAGGYGGEGQIYLCNHQGYVELTHRVATNIKGKIKIHDDVVISNSTSQIKTTSAGVDITAGHSGLTLEGGINPLISMEVGDSRIKVLSNETTLGQGECALGVNGALGAFMRGGTNFKVLVNEDAVEISPLLDTANTKPIIKVCDDKVLLSYLRQGVGPKTTGMVLKLTTKVEVYPLSLSPVMEIEWYINNSVPDIYKATVTPLTIGGVTSDYLLFKKVI